MAIIYHCKVRVLNKIHNTEVRIVLNNFAYDVAKKKESYGFLLGFNGWLLQIAKTDR